MTKFKAPKLRIREAVAILAFLGPSLAGFLLFFSFHLGLLSTTLSLTRLCREISLDWTITVSYGTAHHSAKRL